MTIRDARHLWIDSGALSGPPAHRHQVEFANDVAEFFDDDSRDAETVPLFLPGGDVLWRPLTYRGTDYGQWTDIWRLGLPTPAMGGIPYAGRVLRFTRHTEQTAAGWTIAYELEVDDVGGSDAAAWRASSDALGQSFTTGGPQGRDYGWY
jgi:hypothetical protein